MFQKKRYLSVSAERLRIITHSFLRLKNKLIQQGRYADCVDELLSKLLRPNIL